MHIYHITQVSHAEKTLNLTIIDDKSSQRTISLNKSKCVSQFKPRRNIIVLRDAYLDNEDIVYICNGRIYLNQNPHIIDQYGCECFINYVPDWKNDRSFDLNILKLAIIFECIKNKIKLSKKSNLNLLNLLKNAKGY